MTDNGIDLSGLQKHGVEGFLRFSIKAKDTPDNKAVHSDFKGFAGVVCNDDYTLALKTLLMYYSDRGMFETLHERVAELEARVQELEQKPISKEEDKNEAF